MTKLRITIVDGKPKAELLDDTGKVTATASAIELPDDHTIENVAALRSAFESERAAVKLLARTLKPYGYTFNDKNELREAEGGAISPTEARDALSKVKAGPSKDEAETERRWQAKIAEVVAAKDAEIAASSSKIEKYRERAVHGEVATAIASSKGSTKLLSPIVMRSVKVEETESGETRVVVVDEAGKVRLTKKSNTPAPMSVSEFVESLKTDAEYAAAFEGSGVGGSGTGSTHGGSARAGTSNGTLSPMELLNRANAVPARR